MGGGVGEMEGVMEEGDGVILGQIASASIFQEPLFISAVGGAAPGPVC